ncbi:hypothetical protein ACFL96_17195 [Thermoproteota archaeon]
MWPFKKKIKPDYSKLTEQDKKMSSQEEIDKKDAEFREQSGNLITKVLKKRKKL